MRKKSLRETLTENAKALEAQLKLYGKEPPAGYNSLLVAMDSKPKRVTSVPKVATKPAVPLEHEEQSMFVKWFKMQYKNVRIFAVPNAAARGHNAASYMKAEGLSAGCPDVWIPEFLMCIEMKRIKGSITSPEQISWRDYMLGIGWQAHICNGFEEAKLKVIEFCNEKYIKKSVG